MSGKSETPTFKRSLCAFAAVALAPGCGLFSSNIPKISRIDTLNAAEVQIGGSEDSAVGPIIDTTLEGDPKRIIGATYAVPMNEDGKCPTNRTANVTALRKQGFSPTSTSFPLGVSPGEFVPARGSESRFFVSVNTAANGSVAALFTGSASSEAYVDANLQTIGAVGFKEAATDLPKKIDEWRSSYIRADSPIGLENGVCYVFTVTRAVLRLLTYDEYSKVDGNLDGNVNVVSVNGNVLYSSKRFESRRFFMITPIVLWSNKSYQTVPQQQQKQIENAQQQQQQQQQLSQ